jgi:AcrR family transcriptional regulator
MDSTYNKLIASGIKLFGDSGFDAVSVRDIASEAEVNISAVSYHFGGKSELYQAVVAFLVTEVKTQLDALGSARFIKLSLTEMEQRLPEIIIEFQKMFHSQHGISRLNIFTREIASQDKNSSHQYVSAMIENVHSFFQNILCAYYSQRNESTDKVEFVISLLITTLKNITLRQSEPLCAKYQQPDVLERLIKLIVYGKL